MILISAGLVLAAVILLIAGFVLAKPFLIMWSIVVSVLSALFLVIGALLRRHELFPGGGQAAVPATPPPAGLVPPGVPYNQTGPMGAQASPQPFQRTATLPSPGHSPVPTRGPSPAPASGPQRPLTASGISPDAIVLVIPGRKRYHVQGCRQLIGRGQEELTYEEAREEGFTPCTACLPDAALGGRQLPPAPDPEPAVATAHQAEPTRDPQSPVMPPRPEPKASTPTSPPSPAPSTASTPPRLLPRPLLHPRPLPRHRLRLPRPPPPRPPRARPAGSAGRPPLRPLRPPVPGAARHPGPVARARGPPTGPPGAKRRRRRPSSPCPSPTPTAPPGRTGPSGRAPGQSRRAGDPLAELSAATPPATVRKPNAPPAELSRRSAAALRARSRVAAVVRGVRSPLVSRR